jgi:hypothetical protein
MKMKTKTHKKIDSESIRVDLINSPLPTRNQDKKKIDVQTDLAKKSKVK